MLTNSETLDLMLDQLVQLYNKKKLLIILRMETYLTVSFYKIIYVSIRQTITDIKEFSCDYCNVFIFLCEKAIIQ